jgi:GTP pyrophosphokinase
MSRRGARCFNLDRLAAELGYARLPDFLVEIARGAIGPKQLQDALKPPPEPAPADELASAVARKPSARGGTGVLVVGVDKLLTAPAKCCKPAPPDPIVGFVTRGRGITVHRADCSNVKRLADERRVAAEWGRPSGATFPVDIAVEAVDRTGLLRDISEVLLRERINVSGTSTLTRAHVANMRFTLEVMHIDQLERVLSQVREIPGVLSASRR